MVHTLAFTTKRNRLSIMLFFLSMMMGYSGIAQETQLNAINDVPFDQVEEVPIFPGCKKKKTREKKAVCFSRSISDYVNRNFDTEIARREKLSGVNNIEVLFRIAASGVVEIIDVRAPHPALEEEVERVLTSLPKMTPGMHEGKVVGVTYELPISFWLAG